MDRAAWRYRLAGASGGLLLAAGQFWGPLSLLGAGALIWLMALVLRQERQRTGWAAMAGFYMGLFYAIPQMIYLRMPVHITAILLVWMTLLLTGLGGAIGVLLRRGPVIGPPAVGAAWYLIDWVNCHALPIWGLAQSFARSWSAQPKLIGFVSLTGIGGVLLVLGCVQGAAAWMLVRREYRAAMAAGAVLAMAGGLNMAVLMERPGGSIRIAAAGWVFDDQHSEVDPHSERGFETLFAQPAREAATQGAKVFTTGEMGFYIAGHNRAEWMGRFAAVARENDLWLVVGYFNLEANENRIFFMSPEGTVAAEYTKTYLTPLEPGRKGSGDLQRITVGGVEIGGLICQDDNFARLVRRYGQSKTPVVLCPTADWRTVRTGHLQAVRARAIEYRCGIVRGAACGISAVIGPRGELPACRDHYREGAGWIAADVEVFENATFLARFGSGPILILCTILCGKALKGIECSQRSNSSSKDKSRPKAGIEARLVK
jgi:apolipoprotein N-acyltransferase